MKKLIAIAMIAVLGIAGSVCAESAKAPGKVAHHKNPVLKGDIVAVDAIGNKLIVKDAKEEVTFSVDAAAKIKVAGKPAKLADLKIGDKVSVHYKVVGADKVAVEIK